MPCLPRELLKRNKGGELVVLVDAAPNTTRRATKSIPLNRKKAVEYTYPAGMLKKSTKVVLPMNRENDMKNHNWKNVGCVGFVRIIKTSSSSYDGKPWVFCFIKSVSNTSIPCGTYYWIWVAIFSLLWTISLVLVDVLVLSSWAND